MDKLIDRINLKIKASTEIGIFLFLVVDALVTVWSIHIYETRAVKQYYKEEMGKKNRRRIFYKCKNAKDFSKFTNKR